LSVLPDASQGKFPSQSTQALPSLQEITAWDKQRQDAINSPEISGNSVRCQGCEMFDSSELTPRG
jgi:hypothetical protein